MQCSAASFRTTTTTCSAAVSRAHTRIDCCLRHDVRSISNISLLHHNITHITCSLMISSSMDAVRALAGMPALEKLALMSVNLTGTKLAASEVR